MVVDQLDLTLCAAFSRTAAARPDAVALRAHGGNVELTWREYAVRVRAVAAGLAAVGVRRGDTVGLLLGNRPEFHVVDTAALHLGSTPFSIYNTLAAEQIAHLLENAEVAVLVCEQQYVQRVSEADTQHRLRHLVVLDGEDGHLVGPVGVEVLSLGELEQRGDPRFDLAEVARAVQPDDVATIIYTSGTTGRSKGVELTHANVLAEFAAVNAYLHLDQSDRIVSYLPDAHIANRGACHYNNLVRGIALTTLEDPKQLLAALPAVRPTVFLAVPAIWYKVKAGIEAAVAAEPRGHRRALAGWALRTGTKVAHRRSARQPVGPALAAQHLLAERLVLRPLRARIGLDRVRLALTGASPIAPDALAFVLGLGLPVSEVWGMSETTGAVTLNPPGAVRIGTVGTVVPGGTQIGLAVDGELLVRGPLVMRGYRNDPERTVEAVDADGWLHTGDIATLDDDGYVRIVDRKKELIINAAGKNMSPAAIESTVMVSCPLIGCAVAIGDNRRYVTALLTLDPDAIAAFTATHGLAQRTAVEAADDPLVLAALERGVAAANARLSRVEQVKRYAVLPEPWLPGGDELTPTMKLKRRPIAAKYAEQIDALYT